MTHIIQNLILIQIIVTSIIDLSGFIYSIKQGIGKILHIPNTDRIQLKPFDCSLCSTFWSGLIYLLYTHNLTLPYITFLLFISLNTDITITLFYFIKDSLITVIDKLKRDIETLFE